MISLEDRVRQLELRLDKLEDKRSLIDNVGYRSVSDIVMLYLEDHDTIRPAYLYLALDKRVELHTINVALHRLSKRNEITRVGYGIYKRGINSGS